MMIYLHEGLSGGMMRTGKKFHKRSRKKIKYSFRERKKYMRMCG